MPHPFPNLSFLVTAPERAAPAGFARVRHVPVGGLPSSIVLDPELRLVLVLPTGRIRPWLDGDPLAPIASSDSELAPRADTTTPAAPRAPLRLIALWQREVIGSVPLTLGVRHRLPGHATSSAAAPPIELIVLGWDLRVGNARGPGELGAFVELAWRRLDRVVEPFVAPPVPDVVLARLAADEAGAPS
ncbi:MAG: hypothetical protein U1F43_34135 [Myxococcota bacterium]